jgi:hypothetical protein
MDLARVKALYDQRPNKFTIEERADLKFYFYMLLDKALQPKKEVVEYFVHRLKELEGVKNYSAGIGTLGKFYVNYKI